MKRVEKTVLNEEAKFDVSELFFSTTDAKGIITSCNDVFVRISGFEPEELLTRPHNVVRHPDMPRCVFFLLWQYLLAGRTIGAYVKNLTKEGRYYWVFALASPKSGGFVSVRLRPTSEMLGTVKKLYAKLLQIENSFGGDWRAGMQASAAELQSQLKGLGFSSYDEFMTSGLRSEMLAREQALAQTDAEGERSDDLLTAKCKAMRAIFMRLGGLLDLRVSLLQKEKFFLTLGSHMEKVAVNASVQAAHLATEGRALGVISEEVSHISRNIGHESHVLRNKSTELADGLCEVTLATAQAVLQLQAVQFFLQEQRDRQQSESEQLRCYGAKVRDIVAELEECADASIATTVRGITTLTSSLNSFRDVSDSLEKILLTIQFSYVTGKTLTARIKAGEQFASLLGDMVSLSEAARTEIQQLKTAVSCVRSDIPRWEAVPR